MAGSGERTAMMRHRRRTRPSGKAAVVLPGILGLVIAATLPAATAQAQYLPLPWQYPYYDGYPAPVPPGEVAAREAGARSFGSEEGDGPVPVSEIRRRVATMGFHLIATPRRKNRIYLAEAEDGHGLRHRLVFDAFEGKIIANTKLAPIHKKTLVKSDAAPTATAMTGTTKKIKIATQANAKATLPNGTTAPADVKPPQDPDKN